MSQNVPTISSLATSMGVVIWGLTISEWVTIGGFALAIITLLINWYYKRLHYKLEEDKKKEEE